MGMNLKALPARDTDKLTEVIQPDLTLDAMKAANRWLIWQEIHREGKSKPDKVPHYVDGFKRCGKLDTPEDVSRLSDYETACQARDRLGSGWHLGFALGPDGNDKHWQGIDLDNIDANKLDDLSDALLGYVETSPSGQGVHGIGYGKSFQTLGSNTTGIEAYAGARFFTFTEQVIRDAPVTCLADHVEKVLAPRHTKPKPTTALSLVTNQQIPPQTVSDLRSALNTLSSDSYDQWIAVGLALKGLGDVGRGLWFDWSQQSSKYEANEASAKWDSFKPDNTGYRAVFVKAQDAGWVNPQSHVQHPVQINPYVVSNATPNISAKPFEMPDPCDIPPRPWVFGHWFLRGVVTTIVAPGGVGKSSLMVAAALSLASGREILGKTVWSRPQTVWLWNLEDDLNELKRQLAACALHHDIKKTEYAGRLLVNGANDALCTATKTRDGLTINKPVIDALLAELKNCQIDVLMVDPFVSSHQGEENDNGQIDAIAKLWAHIAREANCAVILVHHSKKLSGQNVDAESSRGASALTNAARTVLVLNRMTPKEAQALGVSEDARRSYICVSNDKSNRAPPEKANWYRLVSVCIGNGGPEGGDNVGVIEKWTPPDTNHAVQQFDDEQRTKVQNLIGTGEWRVNAQASDWAGKAIAEVLGLDTKNSQQKRQVKGLLDDMLAKGQLRTEKKLDGNRKERSFILVGEPARTEDSLAW
jgi:hypothetical protein